MEASLVETPKGPRIVIKGYPTWTVELMGGKAQEPQGATLLVIPARKMKAANAVVVRLGTMMDGATKEHRPYISLVDEQISLRLLRKRKRALPERYVTACELLVNDRYGMKVIQDVFISG